MLVSRMHVFSLHHSIDKRALRSDQVFPIASCELPEKRKFSGFPPFLGESELCAI